MIDDSDTNNDIRSSPFRCPDDVRIFLDRSLRWPHAYRCESWHLDDQGYWTCGTGTRKVLDSLSRWAKDSSELQALSSFGVGHCGDNWIIVIQVKREMHEQDFADFMSLRVDLEYRNLMDVVFYTPANGETPSKIKSLASLAERSMEAAAGLVPWSEMKAGITS